MRLTIEIDREDGGRYLAEVHELPGVMAYGGSAAGGAARVKALALRVLVERIENGEPLPVEVEPLFSTRNAA
jgi:predicted RNase H-like HicB family nuclease